MRRILSFVASAALALVLYFVAPTTSLAQVLVCDRVDAPTICWQYDTLPDEEVVYYEGIDYNTPRVLKWYPEYVFYWPYGCYDWRCGFYGHRVYVQPGVYVNRLTIIFYDPGWIVISRPVGWYWWYSHREHYHYYVPYHGYWDRRVMHVHHYDSWEHRKHGWVAEKHQRFRDFKERPHRRADVRDGYRRDSHYQPDPKWRERWSDTRGKVVTRQSEKPQTDHDRNARDRWHRDDQKKSVTRQDLGKTREIQRPDRREKAQPQSRPDTKARSGQNTHIQKKVPSPQRQSSVEQQRKRDHSKAQQSSRTREPQKVHKQQTPKARDQQRTQKQQRSCDRGRC